MTDRELFIAALDHADPAGRAAWLDRACAGDPDRRRRLDVLLGAHDQASRFLANPARPPADPDDPTRTAHLSDDTSPAAAVDVLALLAPADRPGLLGKLDHYEVLEVVGKGGMGVVVKAFDPKLHRLVAIKLMAPHLAAHGSARKRFDREAKAVAAVRNEHVVAIHAVQTEGPVPYLVMEFVGGISLQERIERRGPADVKEVLRIGMQTALGLAAAHRQGIVHRDVKPANILLENGVERVKLTDFGLARAADDANLTQSGVITGTPNFMSPEQAAGATATAQSDLFSLGSVLYALCTGHPPFRAETPLAVLRRVADDPVRPPREVNPDVPDWLDDIVRKLLAKSPADRFQSASEVAELFGQHLAHLQQPNAVPMPAPVEPPAEAVQRTVVRVAATDTGRMVSSAALRQGRVSEPSWLERTFAGTLPLANPVTDLMAVAGSLDPHHRMVIEQPTALLLAGFDVQLIGTNFEIRCGQRLVRAESLAGVNVGENYDVIVTVDTPSAEVRSRVAALLRSKYAEVADGSAEPAMPDFLTEFMPTLRTKRPGGCLTPVVIAVGLALLIGFRDAIWFGVFQSGYFRPAFAMLFSVLLLVVAWRARRQARPGWERRVYDLAGIILALTITAAVLVVWEDFRDPKRLSEASDWLLCGLITAGFLTNWDNLVKVGRRVLSIGPVAPPPGLPPARDELTAVVLKAGAVAVGCCILMAALYVAFATPGESKAEGLLGLMAGGGFIVLLVFGPGVYLARRRWRKLYGPDRPADPQAVIREPTPNPATVTPTGPAGFAWLVVIGLVAVPALLFGTQESFWEGYFRPGYVAPVSMLVTSGLFLAVLWWCRRQSEPRWYRLVLALAMAAVVGGTLIGLMVSWGEGTYLDKLGGASSWHNGGIGVAAALVIASALVRVARWAATQPRSADPAPAGQAALALGAGYFVVTVGFLASLFVRDFTSPDEAKVRALAYLLGVWVTAGLLAFGPGVFVARRWWRKRLPEERRADGRAAILAGAGLGLTVMAAVLIVVRTPVLRAELFGPAPPADPTVVVNWNSVLVDRVALEADGAVLAEGARPETRLVRVLSPGTYTVRGYKGTREVYAESLSVQPAEQKVVSMFAGAGGPGDGYLRVACADRGLSVTAIGAAHTFAFSHPGYQTVVGQRLRAGEPYSLTIARGADVLHTETVRLTNGEVREFRIPQVVRPERTVDLKPKAGPFPSDVTRMQLSPDRSAVAVERFDGPILVFDVATGQERFTIVRPKSHCTAFGFTPDGKRLAYLAATGPVDHVLRVVDVADGHQVEKDLKPGHERRFSNSHALAFSPDGNRLAVSAAYNAGPDNHWETQVLRWELAPGAEPWELDPLYGWGGMIEALRVTGDGSELLAVNGTDIAVGWRWDTGKESRRYVSARSAIYLVAAGREHEAIAQWEQDRKTAHIGHWSPVVLREEPAHALPLSAVAFGCLAFSPDDRLIAAGTKGLPNLSWDKLAAVHVWDLKSADERAILLGHADWPLAIAFDPDGTGLLTASKDGTLRSWKLP